MFLPLGLSDMGIAVEGRGVDSLPIREEAIVPLDDSLRLPWAIDLHEIIYVSWGKVGILPGAATEEAIGAPSPGDDSWLQTKVVSDV